jgi:hypothetical protein
MANRTNYRGGDTQETDYACDSANYPFEKGDLLWLDPDTLIVKPAKDMADKGDAADNRAYFALHFAGVALEQVGLPTGYRTFRVDQNVQSVVRVATAGDFEFDLDTSASLYASEFMAVYGDADGAPNSQMVTPTATANEMIGQAVPGVYGLANAMTRTVVRIKARVMATYVGTSGT